MHRVSDIRCRGNSFCAHHSLGRAIVIDYRLREGDAIHSVVTTPSSTGTVRWDGPVPCERCATVSRPAAIRIASDEEERAASGPQSMTGWRSLHELLVFANRCWEVWDIAMGNGRKRRDVMDIQTSSSGHDGNVALAEH